MVYKFNRIFVGILILLTLLITYHYNADLVFFSILIVLIFFEFFKSILNNKFLIISFFFLFIFQTFLYFSLEVNFSIILILSYISILSSLFFKKYYKFFFIFFIINILSLVLFLFQYDRDIIYLVIIISFFNDTIAYIFGKSIQGPLITPVLSPKKTWSGTLISFFITTILLIKLDYNILIASIMSISLFIGDIYFSFIKRKLRIKDFSNTLSSHGGILDRIDSISFLILIFGILNI